MHTTASEYGNGDERAKEEDVEEDGQDSEEGQAAKKAGEKNCEGGIDAGAPGDALHSSHPCRNMLVVLAQICQ